FGPDGAAWRRLADWRQRRGDRLPAALLAPLPALGPAWRLGPANALRLALAGVRSPAGLARHLFQTEAARRVIPGLALHVDLGPEDFAGAGLGLRLALPAAGPGCRVPLAGPVPWAAAQARESAVVHAGDSLADLVAFTRQVRAGRLPDNPYLVVGQQSLVDPGRAPPGGHTLWAYSRVPNRLEGGWARQR